MINFFIIFFSLHFAFANSTPKPASRTPVDSFKAITRAMIEKNTQVLDKESAALKKSRLFESYGGFYAAKSLQLKALDDYEKKNFQSSIQKAKEARWKFSEVLVLDPLFPFTEKVQKNIFDSELLIAEAYMGLKNHVLAIHFFENAFSRIHHSQLMIYFPFSSLKNYLKACKSIHLEKCESWLVVFFEKYPGKSIEAEELKKNFPLLEKALQEKPEKKVTQNYRAEDKDDRHFNEAFQLYMDEDYSDASDKLEEFFTLYPSSKHVARALYWLSQSYKKRGKDEKFLETSEKLLKQYPFTYYGIMASFDLKKDIEAVSLTTEIPVFALKSFGLKKAEKEALERIEYFIKNKLFAFAKEELFVFSVSPRMNKDFLMYLAQMSDQAQAPLAAFRFLNEYFSREPVRAATQRHLEIIFPKLFLEKITPLAQKFSLDPLLVMSLIKQESGFHDHAISHAGAVGLMQLMPFTAVAVQPKILQSDVHLVSKNLEIGIEHFSNEVKIFKGNIPAALAAYNAGAGKTRSWLNEAIKKEANLAEFVEYIGYGETRGYVSGILRNYYWYTKKLQNKNLTDFDYLFVDEFKR